MTKEIRELPATPPSCLVPFLTGLVAHLDYDEHYCSAPCCGEATGHRKQVLAGLTCPQLEEQYLTSKLFKNTKERGLPGYVWQRSEKFEPLQNKDV